MKPGVMFSDLCFKCSMVALRIITLSRTGGRDARKEAVAVDWDIDNDGQREEGTFEQYLGGKMRNEHTNLML